MNPKTEKLCGKTLNFITVESNKVQVSSKCRGCKQVTIQEYVTSLEQEFVKATFDVLE